MSARDNKNLHKPTKEQEELLAKGQWGEFEHVILTKHCLFEYTTTHKVGTVDKRSYQVQWNQVGSNSQDASERERIARFISNLPNEDFWLGDLKTLDLMMEWIRWKDRAIDIARYFLAGHDNPDNPLQREFKAGLIDEEKYKYIRSEAHLYENWWQLVQLNEQQIKAVLEKIKSWGYPFDSSRELVEEIIRADLEGEFSNCLKTRYVYDSKEIKQIAVLKRKHHRGELSETEWQELLKLIDQNAPYPIWYDRVISVAEVLAERGNTCIEKHLEINSKIINRLSRMQYQRERSQTTSNTWDKGINTPGIKPGWKS